MKIRSKFIAVALTATVLFFTTEVKSQTTPAHGFALCFGVGTGLATGNERNGTAVVLSGDIRLQYGLSDRLAVTLTTGGNHFFPNKIPGSEYHYTSFGVGPIKVGIKAFFTENLYFGAEGGVGVEVQETGFAGGQTKLLLAPGLGYANNHWDLSIRYENYSGDNFNYGQVALRLGYGFRL